MFWHYSSIRFEYTIAYINLLPVDLMYLLLVCLERKLADFSLFSQFQCISPDNIDIHDDFLFLVI